MICVLCPTDNNNSRVGYGVDMFYQSNVLSQFAGFCNFEKGLVHSAHTQVLCRMGLCAVHFYVSTDMELC
jgi:hypothetical protein